MKKILIPCSILTMILMSFSENNLDKNIPSEGNINLPPCAETVRVDCDGDGVAELEWTVECQYADALREQFQQTCLDAGY